VVPKFKAQIEAGGPITITHPDMVRYFMTIREACDLVVTAASHAVGPNHGDISIYVLNMGQAVKILDLAHRMIKLAGMEPGRDIDVVFTGVRAGERLHEVLFARGEPVADIGIEGIVAAQPPRPSLEIMRSLLANMERVLADKKRADFDGILRQAVPDFRGEAA
jgi:O-antigen biosynthesis protein WbqV